MLEMNRLRGLAEIAIKYYAENDIGPRPQWADDVMAVCGAHAAMADALEAIILENLPYQGVPPFSPDSYLPPSLMNMAREALIKAGAEL